MKSILTFLIGVLLILTLTSCSDNDSDGGSSSGFPSDYDDFVTNYDSDVSIFRDYFDRGYLHIDWYAFSEPVDYSLTVGGIEFTEFDWEYWNDEDYEEWRCYFMFSEDDLVTNDMGYFAYEMGFNGKLNSGEMHLSPSIDAEFPEEYDFDEDIHFSWQAEFQPQLYMLMMFYSYMIFDDDEYGNDADIKQLAASTTSYTIPESFCSNPDADFESIEIVLDAVNYSSQNRIMFWSYTTSYASYGDEMWVPGRNIHKSWHDVKKRVR